jgi:hypothetical protein
MGGSGSGWQRERNVVHASSKKHKAIVGRDRLTWRHTPDGRLLLCRGRGRKPPVTVEPDSKYTGLYRIRFPDGGLSDMVNFTPPKDAALAFALQALNCEAQETPPDASYVRQKRSAVARIPGGLQNVPTSLVPDFLRRADQEASQ